jgi:dipeptidyl aminopeptidase/acylaminoacyl peptidase
MFDTLLRADAARRLVMAFAGFMLAATGLPVTQARAQAVTFDEAFGRQEQFNTVRFSPDGRFLAFTRNNQSRPTQGAFEWLAQDQAFIADLQSGSVAPATSLPPGQTLEMCTTWSPDGRGLLVIGADAGRTYLGYVDRTSGTLQKFGHEPQALCAHWVGGQVLYPVANSVSYWSMGARLDYMRRRWEAAWTGSVAQVTVHSSDPAFPSPPPPESGLALADPTTGASKIIEDGNFTTIRVSPDRRRFAVLRSAEAATDALSAATGRRNMLQVFEVSDGEARKLYESEDVDVATGAVSWSRDSGRVLVAGRTSAEAPASLFVIRLADRSREAFEIPSSLSIWRRTQSHESALPIGWVGDEPAVIAETSATLAPAGEIRSDYGQSRGLGLFLLNRHGATPLSDFSRQSVAIFATSSGGEGLFVADGALWSVARDRPRRRVSPPDLMVRAIGELRDSHGENPALALGRTPAGDRIAVVAEGADGVRVLAVLDLATGSVLDTRPAAELVETSPTLSSSAAISTEGWSARLSLLGDFAGPVDATNEDWSARPLGAVRSIDYALGDRPLKGWLVLPPVSTDGPPPAIVMIYGGQVFGDDPPAATLPGGAATPLYNAQLWAARGYAVIFPSTPVPKGSDGDVPQALTEATLAAIDAAASRSWIDPDRVGIMGHSFGGFSTAAVLSKRSDRFRAGIAVSGVFDLVAGWGQRRPFDSLVDEDSYTFAKETLNYVEDGQGGTGGPPWSDLDVYVRTSPFYHVEAITTPLLMMHGDLDLGVTDLSQGERLYAAMRRTGTPAVLVRYWGEMHVQTDPSAVRDQWARATTWFDHYVRDRSTDTVR